MADAVDDPRQPDSSVTPDGDLGVVTRQMRASLERRLFGADDRVTVGRYQLGNAIGHGGMGTVFRAHDPSLSREVAVKVLRGAEIGAERDALVERLIREAKLLARLNHPNVVTVYDVVEQDGDVFIAMEYVVGRTLRAWMDDAPVRGRLMTGIGLLIDAGRGLAAAHAVGLVHRDFKPDNVLVGGDGRVRVLDFGLARGLLESDPESARTLTSGISPTLTGTGQLVGTPAYMAPEQFDRGVITAAADQYAYCVTLFELACGCRPFSASSVAELASRVKSERPRFPNAKAVPAGLRRVLERGLATDPAQRYPDMATLLAELDRLRGGRRRTAVVMLGVGAIAGAVAVRSLAPTAAPPCSDVATAIDEIWTPTVADEIRTTFAATERSYAASTASHVVVAVDAFAARWRDARVDACEDTRLRGEHSVELMDRRVACLERALRETAAHLDVWRTADAAVVDAAISVAGRLPSTDPCARVDVLSTIAPPPDDPNLRAQIDQVEQGAARARALVTASRFDEATAALAGLSEIAESLGHAPTLANLLESRARLELGHGQLAAATETARRGFSAALRGGDDRYAMRIAVHVAYRMVTYDREPARALEWTDVARSLGVRLGGDAQMEANTARIDGIAHVIAWRLDDAVRELERAIALYRELGDESSVIQVTSDLAGALAESGELERATVLYEQGIAARRELFGPDHRSLTGDLTSLAIVRQRANDLPAAQRALEEAVAIAERVLGRDHVDLGYTLTTLGSTLVMQGDLDGGIAALERALAIRIAALGEDAGFVNETRRSLASAYIEKGRTTEGAAMLERVLVAARKQLAADDPELPVTLALVGADLLRAGEVAQAKALAREAVAGIENSAKAIAAHRKQVFGVCAGVFAGSDEPALAEEMTRRAEAE